jgi:hypothetical protein
MNVGKKSKNALDFAFFNFEKKGKKTSFLDPLITHVWVAKLLFFAFFVIFLQLCKDNIWTEGRGLLSSDLAISKMHIIRLFAEKS